MDSTKIKLVLFTEAMAEAHSSQSVEPTVVPSVPALRKLVQPLTFFPVAPPAPSGGRPATNTTNTHDALLLETGETVTVPTANTTRGRDFVWIDMEGATRAQMKEVLSWLPVHILTRRKILSGGKREKIEFFPTQGYTFLTMSATPEAAASSVFSATPNGHDIYVTADSLPQRERHRRRASSSASSSSSSSSSSDSSSTSDEDEVLRRLRKEREEEELLISVYAVLTDTTLVTFHSAAYQGQELVVQAIAEAFTAATSGSAAVLRESRKQYGGGSAAISTLFGVLVSSVVDTLQSRVSQLLVEADQLDELVLQVMPSNVDQADLLVRTKELRHALARHHTALLRKERLLKLLTLPIMMHESAAGCAIRSLERYQRSLSLARIAIEKTRKGRDMVNLSSMNLVSGVCARLVQHCHHMDYLNQVQSMIALVVMPVAVIPGVFAMNVRVPFEDAESTRPFWVIFAITVSILVFGLIGPVKKLFQYTTPGALAPPMD